VDVLSHFEGLRDKYRFGFSPEYMVAGLEKIHPLYVQWLGQSNFQRNEKMDILRELRQTLSYKGPIKQERAAVIIPARYPSSRFPGKPLAKIKGEPMILHVVRRASEAVGSDNVYVATDSFAIHNMVVGTGYKSILTSPLCLTGTDRVAEAIADLDYEIFVNIQGDEPLIDPHDILAIIEEKKKHPEAVINCFSQISPDENPDSTKLPKVVMSNDNKLVYMSRSNVPATKSGGNARYKQIGMYAFNRGELGIFRDTQKSPVEAEEDIEILRFLEKGVPVRMLETFSKCISVDYPEDIAILEKYLDEQG